MLKPFANPVILVPGPENAVLAVIVVPPMVVPEIAPVDVTDEQATAFDPTMGPTRDVPDTVVPPIVVPEIAPEDVIDEQATAFDPTIGPR
jgi:hypothetical protein